MSSQGKRAVRIAGCSGSTVDRRHAITSLASAATADPVDVIIGDWMSEYNMTSRGGAKTESADAYEPSFLEAIEPALPQIAEHSIKIAVNAGASDTERLHGIVADMVKEKGLQLKVAWISGDEVFPAVQRARESGESEFVNVYTGEKLREWKFEPIYAQAYLGGLGIAAAFANGADIVICGRVSDASPVIGAAYWWHSWKQGDLDQLANAFIAGHLIECSTYVTGGNYTGFKELESKGWDDIGFPIAEISADGHVVITKQKGSGGEVSIHTCSAQLLYEIQGPIYLNSDVAAILDEIWFEQLSTDRVALRGVKSGPPPPTTKIGITARGGYQVELRWYLVGLDIEAKTRMMEAQIRKLLAPYLDGFSKLTFTTNGSAAPDPSSQSAATVEYRVFAQASKMENVMPQRFARPCLDPIMETSPGATPNLDLRSAMPKEIYEYYVTLLPQSKIQHRVHLSSGEILDVPQPPETQVWPSKQDSQSATEKAVPLDSFGPSTRGPLGWLVHARSGDKGSDCNVGFWVRHSDEWDWLRSLLSVDKIKELLGNEYSGDEIDRFELPNLRGVHFLLHNHLDRGVSCTSSYDVLGKNAAEFLRARYVDLPTRFLDRGRL